MITLKQSAITPKTISKQIFGIIRFWIDQPIPYIISNISTLCEYYDINYNIDYDYLYEIIAIPIIKSKLGDRYYIYTQLTGKELTT